MIDTGVVPAVQLTPACRPQPTQVRRWSTAHSTTTQWPCPEVEQQLRAQVEIGPRETFLSLGGFDEKYFIYSEDVA